MRTSLKVIVAAMGAAVLASPVMAQPESHPRTAPSVAGISNAHGSAAASPNAHRSVARIRTDRATGTEGELIGLDDCTHVAFPQCGGPGM
jgi:hypothetical protein